MYKDEEAFHAQIPCFPTATVLIASPFAHATYTNTGWVTNLDIYMDNGVTYFSGFTTSGGCLYNRLELRETGDYYSNVENGRRMYALILSAQLAGRLVRLGYNDTDGPSCRISSVVVQW